MTDRKEPTISAYPSAKDEDARKAPTAGRQKQNSTRSRPAGPGSPQTVVVRSKLAPFAFFIAFLAVGAAGFVYWQLLETQKVLSAADLRIADLESKFELSDDESTASTETITAKLKWADSEIRKLWGVSYDTNRKAIEANKQGLAQLRRSADVLKSSLTESARDLGAELKLVSDLVDAQQSALSQIEGSQRGFSEDYRKVNDTINQLETQRKELDRRIKTNEQAIEAIDAFRRNVNQQLLQLRSGT